MRQGRTRHSRRFRWRRDNMHPDSQDLQLSFVFALSEARSTVQVAGCAPFDLCGAGQGALFCSSLYYQTVRALPTSPMNSPSHHSLEPLMSVVCLPRSPQDHTLAARQRSCMRRMTR